MDGCRWRFADRPFDNSSISWIRSIPASGSVSAKAIGCVAASQVSIDGVISPEGLRARLEPGSEVHFLPAIAGGNLAPWD